MTGTAVGMTAFFVVYFHLLRHPRQPPIVMPLIAVDHWIAFWPPSLVLYLSLWVYVSLGAAFLVRARELVSYAVAAAALAIAGLTMFYLWPTSIPPAGIDWSVHPHFIFLKSVDAAGNACPSLHVAFAVFAGAWLDRSLRAMGAGPVPRIANLCWCLGIAYSTVATRQHVALDVFAGAALGLLAVAANFRITPPPAAMDAPHQDVTMR
ncbi:MAG TPA: phosphatase PAP2 family protein [Candidatus Didemnitutus sp.]|jgi:membrane-associated phospholipid phosphatase